MRDEAALAGTPVSPAVQIIHGQPTDEELVALMTALLMLARAPASQVDQNQAVTHSLWTDRAHLLRAQPYRLSPGNWSRPSFMS